ncbi:hypothetical protein PTTG_26982 [Puccinia triticina 1-1 BBBD Race 1]|uniref:Homeobox domain-containing protein n=2 Tax=Puccinia triticina TaxID=208348 RepID=A0A180GNZ3_PUCT1|nr:uncharacterized protein PtA15_12A420 [Puccinia triticina]OAV94526.1 hypothetical protein PTTG_26982 [Puccinia triticina 1-1 BBBD Race 1]WAQ90431.1 hypothetical protein PtA15_12A420 [Puccinia triticina]
MLFQLRAHNPAESINSNPSSQTSTNSSSSAEHHPHQPHQLFSYAGPLSTPTPPSAAGSAQAIKSSSSSESLNNSIPPPSSAASSSSQSIFNSASSLADTSIGMLPDFLNSQQAAIPGLSPPATRKDDTAADHIPNNHHHHSTSHRQAEPPLLVSTLNLPPSCSSSAASSSSALDHSPGSINGNPILGSKPATSAASPASIWPTPTTAAHLPAEFNDPFRLFHLPQQPQQAQQQQQPFIQTHQQQQPSGSSSSSSPSSHSNLIPPLAQPQPRSQPGQMLLDPSTEFVFGTQPSDLSTHDFLPSPPSPSTLLAQHHFHPLNHHPLYQHPYNRHNSISSPIDHPSFVQAVQIQPYPHHPHQPHPHNPWNAPVDIVHPTTFYDPFQIKHRRRTTPAQLGILEAQFQANCKPDVALRKQLADRLDMTPREVQVWFQNRRAKTKKLEKRAEQESSKSVESEPNGNSSRPEASPPGSIYLSPPSMRALVLPAGLNDNPDQPRIGVSHPSLTSTAHANGESEEVEEGLQYRFDTNTDRRHRSHSLHHHPYYLPPSNLFSGQAGNALTPLAIGNGTLSQQHQQQFGDPSADDQSLICRRSSNTSIASSTATATDSNLIRTPTTTEFSTEDNGTGLPDGFDPRRRSSCPAEFIQSFGHFGLANGQLTDVTNAQIGLDASFTPTTSQTGEHLPSKLSLAPNPSAPFTILEDQNGGWEAQAECWKTETSREGIQRRHSLATIGSPLGVQDFHSNRPIPTDSLTPSQNGLSSLFPWGPVGYPAKHLSSFDSHNSPAIVPTTNVSNGCMSQGYGRRASTSVLKSIEEHPGNMWN